MNAPHEPAVGAAAQFAPNTLSDVAARYLVAYAGRDESRQTVERCVMFAFRELLK